MRVASFSFIVKGSSSTPTVTVIFVCDRRRYDCNRRTCSFTNIKVNTIIA